MVLSIITTGMNGDEVIALFYLYETKSTLFGSLTPDIVKNVQITGLINTKGHINVHTWCKYTNNMRIMLTTLSHQRKVNFIQDDNIITGVIDPEKGKVQQQIITL
jgi:hypothetical protein